MLFTALIMGFAGSLHCVGMCSPLAMAVTNMRREVLLNKFLYNVGRILTYGVLGAMVSSLNLIIPLSGFQHVMSLILGICLLVIGVTGISKVKVPVITAGLQHLSLFLKIQFSKLYKRKTYWTTLLLGTLNGILPCGLTFLALTYCVTLNSPFEGFSFMMLFGIGTFPAMFGLPSVINILIAKFNLNVSRVTTILLIVSGCILVVRVFVITYAQANSIQDGIDIVLCR